MGEKKAVFTVRNVMKVLALLCMIFVFCPSFLVSCSGVTVEIGAMSTVGGVKMYGEEIVKPQPIMLIYLLLPVAVMVFLFLKKFANRLNALIILICSGADLGLWMLFRAITKKEAEDNMCDFATTGWYKMTIIVLIALVVLAVLVLIRKLQMDADLAANISGGGTAGALNQMSKKVGQMSDAVTQLAGNVSASRVSKAEREQAIGFCQKCGAPIAYGVRFCTSCGTPVPESLIAEAEAARHAAEEQAKAEAACQVTEEKEKTEAAEEAKVREIVKSAMKAVDQKEAQQTAESAYVCKNCGAKLSPNARFCVECGTKVES